MHARQFLTRSATRTPASTDHHPWFVEGIGWVETLDLRKGQRIETGDGRGLDVIEVAATDRVERTYNLTVDGWHTFLVGEDGAVVHNACTIMESVANLRNIEEIARGRHIRDVGDLMKQFGGRKDQWRKLKGVGEIGGRSVEVHWYQNAALGKFLGKVKRWLD